MRTLIALFFFALPAFAASDSRWSALLEKSPTVDTYSPRQMVVVANEFITLGATECERTLNDLCEWNDQIWKRTDPPDWAARKRQDSNNERLILLMRVLYVSDAADPIPLPALGQPDFPVKESDWQEWLYFPFEFSRGIPFLLPHQYILGGVAVSARKYHSMCEEKGWLRRRKLMVPETKDLIAGIEALVASRRWRATDWPIVEIDGDPPPSGPRYGKISIEIPSREFLYQQCGLSAPRRAK